MEEKEFRQKVMPLQRMMYAMALRIGLPPDDAADAVQETMLKLWRGREGIPDEDPGKSAYCMTSIKNECLSVLKKKRSDASIENVMELDSDSKGVVETMAAQDTRKMIETLLRYLPPNQQQVIRLSSFGEYNIPEIVAATGFSHGNVRQLLSRGRRRLRELLDQNESN